MLATMLASSFPVLGVVKDHFVINCALVFLTLCIVMSDVGDEGIMMIGYCVPASSQECKHHNQNSGAHEIYDLGFLNLKRGLVNIQTMQMYKVILPLVDTDEEGVAVPDFEDSFNFFNLSE